MIQRYSGKQFDKLFGGDAIFKIFKQRRDRHASTAKYPGAADALSIALRRRTRGPIDHDVMLALPRQDAQLDQAKGRAATDKRQVEVLPRRVPLSAWLGHTR